MSPTGVHDLFALLIENNLFISGFISIFALFNLVNHDACIVEYGSDVFVGQIGVKGQNDFPIINGTNIFSNFYYFYCSYEIC